MDFTAMVSQYQGLVYTVCRQMVNDSDLAEDLAQDTFLSAWRSIDRCPEGYEKQWLARIAANKARDHLKSAWNRKVDAPGDDILSLSGAPPEEQPEALTLEQDGEGRLRDMILALREPYLTPSKLYFLGQYPVEQVAKMCGRPAKTVSAQLFRAKKMLQKQILERRMQDGVV
ncbi:MAG: RNA polymerase sigma factor [Faecalibacterium sp.]|jgi:RNA polymerase sigma-70 factor (ECF subfamily)|nr:RNA polymerase sigma factor [Faecalibacterium sp.]